MSDLMLFGVLQMPYEMAMSDELSRFQFYKTVQRLLEKDSQQQAELEALKAFVKPIIAHGDDCIGNWDGDELQDLAVKTGLLIEVEKTQFCNLDKEEFIGCPCREYHYDEESWVCLNTAKFLLGEAQEK